VAATPDELRSVIAQIEHAPIAAATLVRTLRITETMAIADALTVESLAYATLQAGPEFARWLAAREQPVPPPIEAGPPVLLSRDGDMLSAILNRPINRNAISVEMRDALVEAFALAAADDSIAQLRVSGAGACFSVGGDLSEFGQAPSPAQAHMIRMQRLPARALLPSATRATFHLHSACIGAGIEIPAFAGRITASADAFFQLPEIRFGLMPGAGGCVSIPRRIGRQRMAYLALSARRISAPMALSWGLIDEITP
jgi:enoyl-CoA hydratase/carnithine racemase